MSSDEAKVADQLEEKDRELEALTFSISHDLRAPLRHIIGFAHILRSDPDSTFSPAAVQSLETILSSAERMGKLIEDLVAFSRLARAEMQKIEFNFEPLLKDSIRELERGLNGRKIEWIIHPFNSQIFADRSLLRIIFINLLSNALKFTSTRSEAKIEIGHVKSEDGKFTEIFVRDNGVGFDPQYSHKLFEVFQRLHKREEFEGSGMGLTSVRRIVKRHGGYVRAEGEIDKGATFYFSIPVKES